MLLVAGRQPRRARRAPDPDHGPRLLGRARRRRPSTAAACPADAVLGEAGLGYRYAQVRLAPARLTHCMRWLGLARRALDIALDQAREREAFGRPLLEHGHGAGARGRLGDRHRGQPRADPHCAEALDAGGRGTHESSVAKVFVSEAVGRVVDRSLQICGGLGASDDLPLARYCARGARLPHLRRAERDAPLVDRAPRRAPSPAASGERPGRRRRHAGGGRRAAARRRCVVRRAARGLARRAGARAAGRCAATRIGDGPLERDVPARARRRSAWCCAARRARRCRPRPTTCCARRAC